MNEDSTLDEEMKHDGDDQEESVMMTEEEDEEDFEEEESTVKEMKSMNGKKRNDDEEEDEEVKDETADEDEEDAEDDEEDEDEDDEDKERRKKDLDDDDEEDDEDVTPSKIELSDPASMLYMVRSLTDEEARRHEQYRRSYLDRGAIKRIMAKVIHDCTPMDRKMPAITQVMTIVMAGMTKVFVGEITAEARRLMEKNGETGPIEQRHLREVYRKYYKRRPLARGRPLRRLLR